MERKFHIGDKVETLDDTISGTVSSVNDTRIAILTTEGFIMDFAPSELVLLLPLETPDSVGPIQAASKEEIKKVPKRRKKRKKNEGLLEVDLHIHQLLPSERGLSNHRILQIQIETAERELALAIENKIQRIVFIHGIGNGVLRKALLSLLKKYKNVSFYDAEYSKYGTGATEVRIYANS